jgi:hypothetical protein
MSLAFNAKSLDAKVAVFGLPSAPVVKTTICERTTKVDATIAVKATNPAKAATAAFGTIPCATSTEENKDILNAFIEGGKSTSKDGRVTLNKRKMMDDKYGSITIVTSDGVCRDQFCHYPVVFVPEEKLNKLVLGWVAGETIQVSDDTVEIHDVRLQLEGKLIKVFQDSDKNMRFVSKTSAEVGKEHADLFLDILVRRYYESNPGLNISQAGRAVALALASMTCGGQVLSFRIIHPSLTYVAGPYDLSKNKAVAVCVGVSFPGQQEMAAVKESLTEENRKVITLPEDIYDHCKLESFGAVMATVKEKNGTSYNIKLVSEEHRERHRLVEGINGNFSVHLVRAGIEKAPAIREALDAVHWPAFDEAVKKASERTTEGPAIVARFLERNYRALCTDKSSLVSALCKMDVKMAQKLVSGAKLFNPKRSAAAFVQGMKPEMRDSHARLLTEVVEKKLTHSNPDVSAAARLVKEHC